MDHSECPKIFNKFRYLLEINLNKSNYISSERCDLRVDELFIERLEADELFWLLKNGVKEVLVDSLCCYCCCCNSLAFLSFSSSSLI